MGCGACSQRIDASATTHALAAPQSSVIIEHKPHIRSRALFFFVESVRADNLRELAFHGLFLSFLLLLRPRTRVVGLPCNLGSVVPIMSIAHRREKNDPRITRSCKQTNRSQRRPGVVHFCSLPSRRAKVVHTICDAKDHIKIGVISFTR
jgi:hypothetical protein